MEVPLPEHHIMKSVEVFESVVVMPAGQKCKFLVYISTAMGAICSENGEITENMLESWGAQWIFVLEDSCGSVVGTAFILRPNGSSQVYTLSGLCYEPGNLQIIECILEAAVQIRNANFQSENLVIDLAHDNAEMQSIVEKFVFSSESSGSEDMWIRFALKSAVKNEVTNDQPKEANILPTDAVFKCEKCNKSFKIRQNLKTHSIVHSN
eukprot:205456_1